MLMKEIYMTPVCVNLFTVMVALSGVVVVEPLHRGSRSTNGPRNTRILSLTEAELGEESRMASIVVHIFQLEEQLIRLRNKMETVRDYSNERIKEHRELDARLKKVEGNGCTNKRQFQCGVHDKEERECIGELLVCDGVVDCGNGFDESQEICSIDPISPPDKTYVGTIRWTGCVAKREQEVFVTIIGYRFKQYSTSRVWMKAYIDAKIPNRSQVKKYTAKGYYNFAMKELVLLGERAIEDMAAWCYFRKGDDDRADCTIVKVASMHECGRLSLSIFDSC